jgi:thiamine monophosphate kinase
MAHGAGWQGDPGADRGSAPAGLRLEQLEALGDSGIVSLLGGDVALTTDSFVVKPLRFPGGSIGELAVNGTVNDLAMAGARPVALTLSLILEEGLPAEELKAEVDAIAGTARDAGVQIVAGDTKVVERGHADGMYINTTGLGLVDERAALSPAGLRPGDRILLSGRVGDHGTAIMLARGEFELGATIESDTRSLWPAVDALLDAAGPGLRCLRDATRGGVASVLNELARASGVAIVVREARRAGPPGSRRRVGAARDRPDVRRQRGQARGIRRAGRGGRCARRPACRARRRGRRRDRRGQDGAARDGAGRDRVRWPAGDGPARRRPPAEDLLMHELSLAESSSRSRASTRRGAGRARGAEGRASAPGRPVGARVRVRAAGPGHRARGRGAGDGRGPRGGALPALRGRERVTGFPLACTACGGLDLELLRGEELLVDALELEEAALMNGGSTG